MAFGLLDQLHDFAKVVVRFLRLWVRKMTKDGKKGLAAGMMVGLTIGLMLALFIAIRPELFRALIQ